MTSKLVPQNPSEVMVIRQVTPNISTFSVPFLRFGRMRIGGRGTLVRLPSGALAVFSPCALTPDVHSHIKSTGGTVRYIAALDMEHHIFVEPWAAAFPDAKLIGVEGLPEKRAKSGDKPSSFDVVFDSKDAAAGAPRKVDAEFDAEFDVEYVGAHANKELVVCHKRDRTLIEADLMFNLPAIEQYSKSPESPHEGYLTRLFTGINGTSGGAVKWQRRFLWYIASSANRPQFNASVARISRWDFDRVIPCHGDVIEEGGKAVFRRIMQWHLDAAQKFQTEQR